MNTGVHFIFIKLKQDYKMTCEWKIVKNEIQWTNGDKFVSTKDLPNTENLDDIFKDVTGIFTWTDGESFEGQYKNQDLYGWGTFTWKDGSSYHGIWTKGLRDIFGIHTFNDSTYSGEWKNDKFDGDGCIEYKNGNVLAGEFSNNRFDDPNGFFRYANGDEYRGEFENSLFHGKGIFTYNDGRKYIGEWKHGEKHGDGIFYWPDGDIYKGTWINGKRHGKGIKTKNGVEENVEFKYGKKIKNDNYTNFTSRKK